MRRLGMEGWAGLAMLVVVLAVSFPVLFGLVPPSIPLPLWALVLAAAMAGIVGAGASVGHPVRSRSLLAVAVVAIWVLVLTAPGGLLHVLVVVTAATSVYVATLPVSGVIAVANTVVVLLANLRHELPVTESVMLTGFYLLIQFASIFSTASLLREKRLRTELTHAHVELKTAGILLAEQSRTAERLRISRELHDLIGHQLTVLTLTIEAAKHVEGEQVREHLDSADRTARTLLHDVRTTVGELRGQPVELEAALRAVVEGVPGLDIEIEIDDGLELGEEQTIAAIRLVQEAVTNTIRHSEAEHLSIDVSRQGSEVVLVAADDGVGARSPQLGNGLLGLQERFSALGGSLTIEGRRGFCLTGRVAAS